MEYQKIINLLDNTPNQPTKFRTKNWIGINDDSRGRYNTNSQIRFTASMLRSSLCDYSDAFILVKGTIRVANTAAAGAANNANKKVIFKNCALFTSCISRINNTKIYDAHYIGVVVSMYDLTEHSDNYSKLACRDVPTVDNDNEINDFTEANATTDSFNLKVKLTGDNDTQSVEIMVPLKYVSNFWRTLGMLLISCEVTLDLNWSGNCVIVTTNAAQATLLEQLKSGFKRTIKWNKYQTKVSTERVK